MLLLLSGCPFCLKCFLMSDKFCLFLFVPVSVFLKIFASFSGSVHFLGFVDRTTSLLFQITSSKVCFRYDIRYYVKRARHGSLSYFVKIPCKVSETFNKGNLILTEYSVFFRFSFFFPRGVHL